MASLLSKLEQEALSAGIPLRTQDSMDWFRKRAHDIRRVNRNELMKEDRFELRNQQAVGRMYFWFYQPKHRETLPYYDSFPLGIIVGPAKGGFHALNLHYLPPVIRAAFLDNLMDIATNKKYDDNTRFKITYQTLVGATKFKEFRPCFKHYLTNHVRSRFALVPAAEWEKALFLPAADWQKTTARNVYRDARKMLNA